MTDSTLAERKPRKRKVKPSGKQKLAASILAKNPGKPLGKVLAEAGYSEAMQVNPSEVTESLGFKAAFRKRIPDEKVLAAQELVLDADQGFEKLFPMDMDNEEIKAIVESSGMELLHIHEGGFNGVSKLAYITRPDLKMRAKGVDLAYKILKDEKTEPGKSTTLDLVGFFQGAMRLRVSEKTTQNP